MEEVERNISYHVASKLWCYIFLMPEEITKMTSILESGASNIAQRLVDKTIKEVQYFRDFEDHIQYFVIENNTLVAKRNKVKNDNEDAQRNQNQIEDDIHNWIRVADNIRDDIARQLDLRLEESEEVDRSKVSWSRIYKNEKKLLIILDDVWMELNLTEIGIPSGLDHKNCSVLITTRDSKVCQAMRCQRIVRLHTLDDEDALRLFRFHATSVDNDDSSRNELEGLARDFLKECGGLPIAIVALAGALRNLHVGELNAALKALQNSKSFVDVDEDLVKVYRCLRLSYDHLHNEKAQKLFLLCSIFPEDYEFPIDLIIRLGIGSSIFEEANDYCAARRQALAMKNKLIDSTLLQKVGEKECVKMHDLVREVAQWIADENIQVIKDSRTTLKTNKRFVFWSTNDFPDQFDDTELEILLLWISGNVQGKDPNAFFARMSRLKILFLLGDGCERKVPPPSLLKSLFPLKYIHTLILDVIELPKNFMELKKLRWLGMRNCEIEKNNPFKVIEKCTQLEEVYFVENFNVKDWNTEDDIEIEDEIVKIYLYWVANIFYCL
ncbi:hypothetical protein K1719_042563 [Acacia pycnantha]|nr:hypothetical protein K1719_042563 [Acacia pycnantha]